MTQEKLQLVESWMVSPEPASARRFSIHMVIKPALAKLWMEANKGNRPIRESRVIQYGCDMLEGRWQYNGECIKFSKEGILIDGQHRLLAVIDSGVPLETDVVFGLEFCSRNTIDTHGPRSAGDIAGFNGVSYAKSACAVAHLLLIHRKHGIGRMTNPDLAPTKSQTVAVVRSDSGISAAAAKASGFCTRLAAPSVVGFCYYLFAEQDPTLADGFIRQLDNGVGLSANSSIHLLRERLAANKASKSKLPKVEVIALFFKAWIAFRDGQGIGVLRWRNGGPSPEPFPDITKISKVRRMA